MLGSVKKQKAKLLENHHKLKKEAFDFDQIERYFRGGDPSDALQTISDKTYHDLDMDEVFMYADRTVSKLGQQYFYHILRTLPKHAERSKKFESLIKTFEDDPEHKASLLFQLSRLDKREAYYISTLFQEEYIAKPSWFWVIQMFSLISMATIVLSFFYPQLIILLVFILTINYIMHYWNKKNLYQYGGAIPQLLILNQVAKEIQKTKIHAEEKETLNQALQTIDSIGYKMSFFKLEATLESEVGQAVEFIIEVIKALLLIEPLLLFHVLHELDSKREQVHQLYKYVGETDVAIAISSLRGGLAFWTPPVITEKKQYLSGKDIGHPLIQACVANSIVLEGKSALLTGSNMSGKTTFIRTLGINVILGQTINTCFAREFIMPRLRIHSAIRITDDLMSDKSYYFEEVLTIKQMLEESRSGTQNIFLLDEMFKGTNTVERIAAGKSVLSYLNDQCNFVCISTHDLELAEYLKETYDLYHFTEVVENETILFDYKIKAGNLNTTNAIRILELNHYPPEVIMEARQISGEMNKGKR